MIFPEHQDGCESLLSFSLETLNKRCALLLKTHHPVRGELNDTLKIGLSLNMDTNRKHMKPFRDGPCVSESCTHTDTAACCWCETGNSEVPVLRTGSCLCKTYCIRIRTDRISHPKQGRYNLQYVCPAAEKGVSLEWLGRNACPFSIALTSERGYFTELVLKPNVHQRMFAHIRF